MTDSELERVVQEAEYLIEAGHEDMKNGVMSKEDQVRHSQWVYDVLMRDCPMDVIRAVQEYEIFIISETDSCAPYRGKKLGTLCLRKEQEGHEDPAASGS